MKNTIMKKFFTLLGNVAAISTTSYSLIGMYKPVSPKKIMKNNE